jgi:RND family efflux transporter MFP subunit
MIRFGAVVVLLASASACGGCRREGGGTGDASTEPAGVSVEVARLQTLRLTVSGPGQVAPAATADWTIYAPETGRVAELPKAEGDAVKVGDVLVRFDYGSIAADISAREGDLAAANGRLGAAQAQVTRISAMFDRGFAARAELETAKAAVTSAELDIARLKQQLQAANTAAEHATVKARFAGVVAKRFHSEGDMVNASPTDPVLRVVDPTQVQVSMSVPLADAAQVQQGQMATIISANGAEPGIVVARATPNDPQAATQEIRLAFSAPTTLPLESPVQVEILLAERLQVIALPTAAILRGPDGTPFVMLAGDDGRAHRREVRVGFAARERTEIISGLTAGERVIVKDAGTVTDGAPVIADR